MNPPSPVTAPALQRLLQHFPDAKPCAGGQFKARCPAHEDKTASLSFGPGTNGGAVLHCHAGCKVTAIVAELGLKMSDLMPPREARPPDEEWKEVRGSRSLVCAYDYVDENGTLLYQAVRYRYQQRNTQTGEVQAAKTFKFRRPDKGSRDGWTWSLAGVSRVLYHLPDVREAVREGRRLWIPEGEKDADNLRGLGLDATTKVGGAKAPWLDTFTQTLAGADVVLLPDNDDPGRKAVQVIAAALYGKVASLRVLDLPGLPEKGDVSDWIAAGGTREALQALSDAAPAWTPPPLLPVPSGDTGAVETDEGDPFRTTDYGNSERLVKWHGKDLHYCNEMGWLVWNGKRWQIDKSGEVERRTKKVIRHIYTVAAQLEKEVAALTAQLAEASEGERERLKKRQATLVDRAKELKAHAHKSEASPRLEAAQKLAQTEPGIPIAVTELDTNNYLLNCQNGTLDLRTGELRPPDRADLITRLCPVNYNEAAVAPLFAACLERWQPCPEVRAFLQRAGGYTLTGLTGEQTAFFTYGSGSNGKSMFMGALEFVMGDYATRLRADVLMESKRDSGGTTPDLVDLPGVRLVIASEIEAGHRLREGFIKDLTGNERISVNPKHKSVFRFTPVFKLWLYGNHKPTFRGTDWGIRRRLPLIPFAVTVPAREVDPDLLTKLQAEGEGILRWLVKGYADYQQVRLSPPPAVVEATKEYHAEQDTLQGFFDTCCVFTPNAWTPSPSLSQLLKSFCEGEGQRTPAPNELRERLRAAGCEPVSQRYRSLPTRGWRGVGLVTDASDDAEADLPDALDVDSVYGVDTDSQNSVKPKNLLLQGDFPERVSTLSTPSTEPSTEGGKRGRWEGVAEKTGSREGYTEGNDSVKNWEPYGG